MPPIKHLILVALFFVFGLLAVTADADSARLHWAALAIMTFGGHGLLVAWGGIKAGQIHLWSTVIHRHNRPQQFWGAAGLAVAGGIVCVVGGLWVLEL
jgi:hypothetical protein